MHTVNRYYDTAYLKDEISRGEHRGTIGGMWDKIGQLQFDYARAAGLRSDMTFLDIGCGCLRGGVHFVDYLDAGGYYGIDLSLDLLEVGYNVELRQAGLHHKLPREQLHATDGFEMAGFGKTFDMALAVSVFSHLSWNHLRLCLTRLAPVMASGGVFLASYFPCPDTHDWSLPLKHPNGKWSHPDRDPFHYREKDLHSATRDLPWRLEVCKNWSHPRDQWMAHFVKDETT